MQSFYAPIRGEREMEQEKMDQILSKFPETRGNLIGILHEIQNEFRYLPVEELEYLSRKTGFKMTQIYSIAIFYHRFSLTPKGEHELCVCLGTACHVKGGNELLNRVKKDLKIKQGETTKDMKFTLEVVRCIGACSLAPAVMVDGETHANLTPDTISQVVNSLQAEVD
jgi:NADH-quinone oxidoreductase subunit E